MREIEETTPVVCNSRRIFFIDENTLSDGAEEYLLNHPIFKCKWPSRWQFFEVSGSRHRRRKLAMLIKEPQEENVNDGMSQKSAVLLYEDNRHEWIRWPDPRLKEANRGDLKAFLENGFFLRLSQLDEPDWVKVNLVPNNRQAGLK